MNVFFIFLSAPPKSASLWLHSTSHDSKPPTTFPPHQSLFTSLESGHRYTFTCAIEGANPKAQFDISVVTAHGEILREETTLKNLQYFGLQSNIRGRTTPRNKGYGQESATVLKPELSTSIEFVATPEYDNCELLCVVNNPELPQHKITKRIRLSVPREYILILLSSI